MRTSIGLLTLLLLPTCATQLPSTGDPIRDAERRLTRAIVRSDRAVLNELIADDFTCAVTGNVKLAFEGQMARATLCTAIGIDRPAQDPAFEEEVAAKPPRSAVIDAMDVRHEGDAVVVVTSQSYRGWYPNDSMNVRRAQVTDRWEQRNGRWQIVRRVSEPRS